MNKQAYLKGVIIPVSIVLSVAVLSGMGYFGLRGVQISVLRPPIIMILGTTYFLAIVFGVGVVFTTAYINGISLGGRILAAFDRSCSMDDKGSGQLPGTTLPKYRHCPNHA